MNTVHTRVDGLVRTITLDRPEKRNALSVEMLAELEAALAAPPAAEERVLVIRSVGPVFCAGLDLRERVRDGVSKGESPIGTALHLVEHHPLPAVAVVQGDAIAGGCELSLACDFVVASTTARFGMSLVQLGLAPTWLLAKKLLEIAGPVATREILLLGDPLPSARMHALGIISHLAEPGELEAMATGVIERLAANAPLSLRSTKALITREMQFRDHIPHDDVDRLIEAARMSEDAREGMAARIEQRAPVFRGV